MGATWETLKCHISTRRKQFRETLYVHNDSMPRSPHTSATATHSDQDRDWGAQRPRFLKLCPHAFLRLCSKLLVLPGEAEALLQQN